MSSNNDDDRDALAWRMPMVLLVASLFISADVTLLSFVPLIEK